MQYDVDNPSEYLKALDEDWRKEKVLMLREMILEKNPEIEEGIKYKMLSFGDGKRDVFQLNAQKNYVSLYVGDIEKVDPAGDLLNGFNLGKGCIRISKSVSIPDTRLDEFIERTIQLWKSGADTGC